MEHVSDQVAAPEAVAPEVADADTRDVVEAAGHFRIYLGAAAGVGKTYAMLSEGHRREGRGTDVVVGFVECHGRRLTKEMIGGLEVIPRTRIEYRGSHLEEMDLDAALRKAARAAASESLGQSPAERPGLVQVSTPEEAEAGS
jgi:K+-sensing histidine kinase KdpD